MRLQHAVLILKIQCPIFHPQCS